MLRDISTPAYLSIRKPVNYTASQPAADQTEKEFITHNLYTMHIPFLPPHPSDSNNITSEQIFDPVHDPNAYTTEGSEFLDDAIRMKDQPLQYTEESIAAGSPEGLL